MCVLNWGLGHAARCIPIIKLLIPNSDLTLASDGAVALFLKSEFPQLKVLELPGYNIHYKGNFVLSMGLQLPKIVNAIRREKQFLERLQQIEKFDIIISDNRYGCYHKECNNILITHQLRVKMPNQLMEVSVAKVLAQLVEKFDECWVPDFEGRINLSGTLSHGIEFRNINVRYVGPLSRMRSFDAKKAYDAIAVLSGPEPARTKFENILLQEMVRLDMKFLLVQGLPENSLKKRTEQNVTIQNYLGSEALNKAIMQSEIVICRTGYSSLMDLMKMRKKAILVPTPGQTEQEYLAELIKGKFYCVKQKELNLANAIQEVETKLGFSAFPSTEGILDEIIDKMLWH